MQTLNRVLLCGRLGANPEIKLSQNGRPYTRLSLATDRNYMEGEQWKRKAEWHSVFVWGELAERCAHNYRKGALLFIEGSLSYWQVASVNKEYKNAIHAERVNLIYQPQPRPLEGSSEATDAATEEIDTALDHDEGLDNPPGSRNHNAVAHPA